MSALPLPPQVSDAPEVLRFGRCEVRLVTREVLCDGDLQPVRRRVFDLIVYLVQQRPRAVRHGELLRALWGRPDVATSLLARAVMEARRALGDASAALIVSVHGVGYRFAGEVDDGLRAPPAHPAPALPEAERAAGDWADASAPDETATLRRRLTEARTCLLEHRYDEAGRIADALMARADAQGSNADRVGAMLVRSAIALNTEDASTAAALASRALRMARAEGFEPLIADALVASGGVHVAAGDLDIGIAHLRAAQEVLAAPGREVDLIRCLTWQSLGLRRQGDLAAGLQVCRRSIQIGVNAGHARFARMGRQNEVLFVCGLGDQAAQAGDTARAQTLFKEALELSHALLRETDTDALRGLWLAVLDNHAMVLERLGRLDEAWQASEQHRLALLQAPDLAAQIGRGNGPQIDISRARLLARLGRADEALALATAALAQAEELGHRVELDELYREASNIAEIAGDIRLALRWQRARCDALAVLQKGRAASLAAIIAAEHDAEDQQQRLDAALAENHGLLRECDRLRRQLDARAAGTGGGADEAPVEAARLAEVFRPAQLHARARGLPLCIGVLWADEGAAPSTRRPARRPAPWADAVRLLQGLPDVGRPLVRLDQGLAFHIRDAGPARARALCEQILELLARRDGSRPDAPRWQCSSADLALADGLREAVLGLRLARSTAALPPG